MCREPRELELSMGWEGRAVEKELRKPIVTLRSYQQNPSLAFSLGACAILPAESRNPKRSITTTQQRCSGLRSLGMEYLMLLVESGTVRVPF